VTFSNKLALAQASAGSVLCVGLDPVLERLPAPFRGLPAAEAVVSFCQTIIEATSPVACAFKPNLAFFEALGRDGYFILESVIGSIPSDRVVVLDGKRSDIAHSASLYAESLFGILQADACTVAPYMGRDAVDPFLAANRARLASLSARVTLMR
jgi:orotidine-5'-phosphate decarboxylase